MIKVRIWRWRNYHGLFSGYDVITKGLSYKEGAEGTEAREGDVTMKAEVREIGKDEKEQDPMVLHLPFVYGETSQEQV